MKATVLKDAHVPGDIAAPATSPERSILSRHHIATIGSKTKRGGEVITASADSEINSLPVARVNDTVRYPDGSESRTTSGAGFAAMVENIPLAIVGSHIANGDIIVSSTQNTVEIRQYADGPAIPGFLEEGYVPPAQKE